MTRLEPAGRGKGTLVGRHCEDSGGMAAAGEGMVANGLWVSVAQNGSGLN